MRKNKMNTNTNTELKKIAEYTVEELIEMGKKMAYRNIESEMPTTEKMENGKYTIYRIIYK